MAPSENPISANRGGSRRMSPAMAAAGAPAMRNVPVMPSRSSTGAKTLVGKCSRQQQGGVSTEDHVDPEARSADSLPQPPLR